MTDLSQSDSSSVAGAGLAELPIPKRLRFLKAALAFGVFSCVLTIAFMLNGWDWVSAGLTKEVSARAAAVVTAAFALAMAPLFLGVFNKLLNIRKKKGRWVFGGFYSKRQPFAALVICGALYAIAAAAIVQSVRTCPLPELLAVIKLDAPQVSATEAMMPIYFWDYATWIKPEWFDDVDLVIPYEKGPPKKLLSKIYFQNAKSRKIELELHGKRPRSYDQNEVFEIFNANVVNPSAWPLLWKLQREAGLIADNIKPETLYLMRLIQSGTSNVTQAIGVPWEASTPVSRARAGSGHLFFWGPDGSVFQIKCQSPCLMARLLELVQFPVDPKGSHAERLEWTKSMIKKLLAQSAQTSSNELERARNENLLSLYLVSMLSQDPRDPEAFFHLGKLAKNRETANAAIKYGRDLGLEPMKILELQNVANRLSF